MPNPNSNPNPDPDPDPNPNPNPNQVNELMAQAQVPLSAASLEGVDEAQRDSLLGERLYALLSATHAAPQAS